eukprot:CAMPEP_0114313272 /NCGR_PEP_ID=MMETSP0059-20121206/21005_1 /TAXON_ID=36894 /ORGANISM="Pyramimonas parkeae, Strain CCMP726" /LENGTH=455 /DNA_ID=CAMNT_0001437973 /DNA_START=186 /DNA_END=1554 /DNA_ORIENTATION=+
MRYSAWPSSFDRHADGDSIVAREQPRLHMRGCNFRIFRIKCSFGSSKQFALYQSYLPFGDAGLSECCANPVRRALLLLAGSQPLFSLLASSEASVALTPSGLRADLPMRRIRLPQGAVGRDYVVVQLKIAGKGPFDFMVDSGLTGELITPHLQAKLGASIGTDGSKELAGLGAGGKTLRSTLLDLSATSIWGGDFTLEDGTKVNELPLPKLHAFVTDFPQEHMDPDHDPVEGMLGMEVLSLFDVDFDFPMGRLRLWAPGSAEHEAKRAGLIEIPAAVLNETGLLGIRLTSAQQPAGSQPLVGVIDTGASFSIINWAGAQLLGLPSQGDRSYRSMPTVSVVGVDGRLQLLPTQNVSLTFCGDVEREKKKTRGKPQFAPAPESWKAWDQVQMGVGDLAAFSQLLGDGRQSFQGPAAILGLDVLAQRRVILETSGSKDAVAFLLDPSSLMVLAAATSH